MVMLVRDIEDYLYSTKKDAFILQFKDQSDNWWFDKEDQANILVQEEYLKWFDDRGIKYDKTVTPGTLEGWSGHYYIHFAESNDPYIAEYSNEFETDNKSKYPDKFQMYCIQYHSWVDSGKLAQYEQHLKDREDPNWEY